jgi:beta-galactosidase
MIKKSLLFPLMLFFSGIAISQEVEFLPSDWEDPSVFEKGQNAPHAFHVPYASAEAALENNPATSKYFQLLNGQWKFKWVGTPEQVPEGFWQPGYNVKDWNEIRVPSDWQMEGYGYPKFRNVALSFESDPPHIPDYFNPVGCYKSTITIPKEWNNKEVMLRFEGIKSASYIWVNGKRVGYNQGGFEPAEFNITRYIKTGKNDLSVEVIRFCDGSYLENQDMWRLSGIYRDVKLYAQPKTFVHDFYIVTDLDDDYRDATLVVETDIQNTGSEKTSVQVEIDVLDQRNRSILNNRIQSGNKEIVSNSLEKVRLSARVRDPEKWSAEYPNLYKILIQLKDGNGEVLEAFTREMGFREVEYKNQILTVNGVPVKLNGINSHMHDPDHGQAVPLETLRKDLLIMKQHNINCVRTCHYPPTPEYIELADELGIYIFDEVGDEAHGNTWLSGDPAWTEMYRDRSRKLVYRDRNHPSVIVWSAGNESGSGDNIKAVIETGKSIDPGRPAWMYGGNAFYIPFEDIVGPRYWIPLAVRNLAVGKALPEGDHRASFMDEYIAATGNGLGGMDEYWELIRSFPRLTGGAIWDYVSPGVTTPRWILPDLSPRKNDGQIMGRPVFTEGKNGRGLEFTGHDDWVEFYRDPSLGITGNQLSIGFWVKPFEIPQPNVFITKGQHGYGIQMEDPGTLEFYVNGEVRGGFFGRGDSPRKSVKATVGKDFYGKWHYVAGIYDGSSMKLYIDDELAGEASYSGPITPTPFPLCVGREAENQDQGEWSGRMSSMVIDDVRVFDHAVSLSELKTNSGDAVLALDFETDTKNRESFFAVGLGGRTYGVIWPNREIQPELNQMKKSGQPVGFELIDAEKGIVQIKNHHHFKNLNELAGSWALQVNGKVVQQGNLNVDLPAQQSSQVTIPVQPVEVPGEAILLVSFKLKVDLEWAGAGQEVAWEQFVLPAQPVAKSVEKPAGQLQVEENDSEIKIMGEHFSYALDRHTGQFNSLRFNGTEYLEKGPEFMIWRAPMANDVDPWGSYMFFSRNVTEGYGRSIDNQLRTLGLRDMQNEVDEIEIQKNSGEAVTVRIKAWSVSSLPVSAGFGNRYGSAFERNETWTFLADGSIELEQEIIPHGIMPEMLPKEGLQFLLPREFNQVEWYGRGPFETYPDRKTGAKVGLFESDADEMYEPYIIPQDYGNRTDVRWLKVGNGEGKGLQFQGDVPLNFSLHKYTTDRLSRAVYTYQLEEAPYTVLNVDYQVSGVGGTAMRQQQRYRLKAAQRSYRLKITPF